MSGPVEWTILIFVVGIVLFSFGLAWQSRSILAEYELGLAALDAKYSLMIASLSRALEDRNFLVKYDLAIADLIKDVRHTKNNVKYHSEIFQNLSDNLIRMQKDVERISKIVNGKH